jgi:hypothetical protein
MPGKTSPKMNMTLNRTLIAIAILALSITAAAGFLRHGSNQEAQSSKAASPDEPSRQVLIADQLASLLAPAGVQVVAGFQAQDTETFRQVQVHWETPAPGKSAGNTQPETETLTLKQSVRGAGSLPRRRSLELADTEILVIAVDENSRLMWWHVTTDPRLLRAENVNERGEISGGVSYLPQVDFSIAYPDDPAIKELRIYHPVWTGMEFRLTSLAVLSVR